MKAARTLFFLFLLVGLGLQLGAQAPATEGRVVYDMKVSGKGIDPMTAMMLSGANVDVAFNGAKTRAAMKMAVMSSTAVIDNQAQKGLVLINAMGKKMAMEMKPEDFKDQQRSGNYQIIKTTSTKTIAGYLCFLAYVQDTTGEKYEVWYTNKIKYDGSASGFSYDGIDGLPLEVEINQDGMKMRLHAKSVKVGTQDPALFDMKIPAGYELKSPEELQKMGEK
jgi:GLPGLI family protein